MKIEIINQQKFDELLDSSDGKGNYQPKGLFIYPERPTKWTAIDNENGSAWVEDFKSKELAEKWLNHEFYVDDNGGFVETVGESDDIPVSVRCQIMDEIIAELAKNDGIGSWGEAVSVVKKMKRKYKI